VIPLALDLSAQIPLAESRTAELALAAIGANVLMDQLGLPVPALPALLFAGAAAARYPGWAARVLILSVTASVFANLLWYAAGRRFGLRVMRLICRISVSPDSCVSTSQGRFERWGDAALLLSKFIPGLGVMAPTLAGALSMAWQPFVTLSVASALLWVGSSLLLGGVFGAQLLALLYRLRHFGRWALLLITLVFVVYVAVRAWRRWRFQAQLRMARISVRQLQAQLSTACAPLILDVRSSAARRLQPWQIPGALHVPPERIASSLAALPRDRQIVLYCTCPREASAAWIARRLMDAGLTRPHPLLGGLDAWMDAGLPVHPVLGAVPEAHASQSGITQA
jgi:membrane protein DedA with SNARE-associated domain/rhodanese-related sulfurtransferase